MLYLHSVNILKILGGGALHCLITSIIFKVDKCFLQQNNHKRLFYKLYGQNCGIPIENSFNWAGNFTKTELLLI